MGDIVYSGVVLGCDALGNITTGKTFVEQATCYEGVVVTNGFVIAIDTLHYFVPEAMGVMVDPSLHRIGCANPVKNAYEKHCMSIKDYTKAYAAFGKDRLLDYAPQVNKDMLIDETSNDENKVSR